MLLKNVLEINEVNRNTYNSLERRTGLPFMKRGLVEGKRGDRYTFTHAIALATMLRFQQVGVEAKDAATVVDACYEPLIDWVATLLIDRNRIDADHCWITISHFRDGTIGWATGPEGADTFSADPPFSKLSLNVAILVDELYPRLVLASD